MDLFATINSGLFAAVDAPSVLDRVWFYVQIFIGFSFIIFVHELGHFIAAKWAGVRVEQFAIGFMREIFGFTYGETRYSFNLLPLGGYVKMLGQEDFEVDTSGDLQFKDDPRSFANKSVGHRMVIVSAGVVMNLVLAGVLFMTVFLIGKDVASTRIGMVVPDTPAAEAGLLPGDIVKRINGGEIDEFNEINMAVVLSKPDEPLDIEILRGGETKHIKVSPELNAKEQVRQIGIQPAQTAELLGTGLGNDFSNPRHPRPNDVIVRMGDTEVTEDNAHQMIALLATNPLDYPEVIVERPSVWNDPDSPKQRVPVDLLPSLLLRRSEVKEQSDDDRKDPQDVGNPAHLLGLVPLRQFSYVEPRGRAELAGIEQGDIVLDWDGIANPTAKQIDSSIVASAEVDPLHPERDIPIVVQRGRTGKRQHLTVRPKVKTVPILGKRKRPTIGADYAVLADDILRVALVVADVDGWPTPAAVSGIPQGALITKVNDVVVSRWVDLCEQLRRAAGSTVTITYDYAGEKNATCEFPVPHSLRTKLGLGPESVIVSIDGEEKAVVKKGEREIPAIVNHPVALRVALLNAVGKTVEVKYRINTFAETQTAEIEITEDMVYPWLGTVGYSVYLALAPEMVVLKKDNPIAAVKVGIKKTYYFVMQVYQVMERMIFSRSFGVENISGPVGIVKLGSQMAEAGSVQLMFFLAIISANLAVINFLPLPIVDGGLMVFLLIEKIKGSPISIRVQVATQVIGLILIVSAFLFVTLQDLAR